MLKNYLKIAFRNLYKNKLYSIINIVGLGISIALCVAAYVNHEFSRSFNSMYENRSQLYLVNSYKIQDNERLEYSNIPIPMTPAIKNDIAGIEKICRVTTGSGTLRFEDKIFNEFFYYVDEKFLELFPLSTLAGASDALTEKNNIVITDELAKKYFDDGEAVGKQLIFSRDGDKEYEFIVGAVIPAPPMNSCLQMDAILPYDRLKDIAEFDLLGWDMWAAATVVQIKDESNVRPIEQQLQGYVQQANEANPDWLVNGFYLLPLNELASVSRELRGDPFRPGMHPAAIIAPSVTAILILLLACFNFINTSIAFASRRLKEIGIRKVTGGTRKQLIIQFMGENLLLCLIALLLACALAEVFVPAYDSLWPEISLSMNYSENLGIVGALVGLLIFTGLAAGFYPAFYISGFKPATILKGKQSIGGINVLIKVLLTFQFSLAITVIIAAVIFNKNASFIKNFDPGFTKENILVVPVRGEGNYRLLKTTIENHPDITGIGGSRHLMGRVWAGVDIETEKGKDVIWYMEIGENYFETAGFKLSEGRSFDYGLKTEINNSTIVNETFMEELGWTSHQDKRIKFIYEDSVKECNVIGVVRDFHINGVATRLTPIALRLGPEERYWHLSLKYKPDKLPEVSAYIQDTWKRLFPHLPYDARFQEEIMEDDTQTNRSIRLVFVYIAIMAVSIAAMGLFALVSLNITRRIKEIGIRKVLGATVANIGAIISKEFIILFLVGSILASVMAYFMLDTMMASIWAYYTDFGIFPFFVAAILAFIIGSLTVGYQVYSAAAANPVNSLRDE
ncbi:MAG: ABC transporter permease [Candidatus Zixiibacteriota bacterium]|nr:MAG: ABC transporter permease [candidate division Zixibacteria bacterium]